MTTECTPLPTDDNGDIDTSADFGYLYAVQIEYTTDFDGRQIDEAKEDYPSTLHGPFFSTKEAERWMNAYPDDTDVHDITVITLNRVRPEEDE